MASINGLSVKNFKKFKGHEGEPCYQGNLYLGKTKIGFWSQDGHGAIVDDVNLDENYSERKLEQQITVLNQEKAVKGISRTGTPYTIGYNLTKLMTDYLELLEGQLLGTEVPSL